jgi:hypothetical protein
MGIDDRVSIDDEASGMSKKREITREEALEFYLNRLGFSVITDESGGLFHLASGQWAPVGIKLVDPLAALHLLSTSVGAFMREREPWPLPVTRNCHDIDGKGECSSCFSGKQQHHRCPRVVYPT